jgi:hypothetical protein
MSVTRFLAARRKQLGDSAHRGVEWGRRDDVEDGRGGRRWQQRHSDDTHMSERTLFGACMEKANGVMDPAGRRNLTAWRQSQLLPPTDRDGIKPSHSVAAKREVPCPVCQLPAESGSHCLATR